MGKFPKIKRISVWLTPSLSYRLDLEKMKVNIASVGDLQIIGYPRNYTLYKDWEIREARFLIRDDKEFPKATFLDVLKVTFPKEIQQQTASDGVAVDVNMENLAVGNDKQPPVFIFSRIDEAKHFKSLAEGLQKKYGNKTYIKRIHERYLSLYRRATL